MRILISTDTYYPHVNGSSYFTQRLSHYLAQKNHDVMVIAPSLRLSSEYRKINGITVFGLWSLPVFFYKGFRVVPPFAIKKDIEKAFTGFKPDIVHVQDHFTVPGIVIQVAQDRGIPVVGTNHFMPENLIHYLFMPEFLSGPIMNWGWNYFRKIYESIDAVTTPTKSAADLVIKHGFSKEVKVISCGIDLTRFHPSKKDDAIRKKYRLPESPLLLYVGRLDREKNIDFILKAVSKVPKTIPLHFAVAGSGYEKKRLEKIAEDIGLRDRVTFLGFVPDEELPALYATSYCFVIAGIAELQSIVTMEAMASGLPVLAVNAVALPELVHNGENGYLFDLDNENILAEHIGDIFSNPALRERMAKQSLEFIIRHDINKSISDFETLYRQVTS